MVGKAHFARNRRRHLRAVLVVIFVAASVVSIQPFAVAATPSFVRPNALAPGNAPTGSTPLGALPNSQQIELSFVLPPSNNSQLQSLLNNLYDPNSPDYHQWLRPGQFAHEFGPTAANTAAVESWLHGVGLTQTTVSDFAVNVTASASQLSVALGTSFQRFQTPLGHVGYLVQKTPLVPQSLAGGQIAAILGLNTVSTFQPQGNTASATQIGGTSALHPNADGLTACSSAQSEAAPGYYTLDTLGAGYGIGSLLADGQNGHGETVGVYELGQAIGSDIATYESCFGLTNPVYADEIDGGAASGASGTAEADADMEQAATQAPGATIISYEGPNTATGQYDTWNAIVSDDVAQVISTSWGMCEPAAAVDGTIGADTTLFERAASQGQTIFAATGDSGSEGCYTPPTDYSTAEEVLYPASDPWVTAVGGTTRFSNGEEVAWNTCQSDESTVCADDDGGAGGGGMSRYESRPSYQPNILYWTSAQPCGQYCRELPDISANAGDPMVLYANGNWTAAEGTSLAAPLMAGLVADINDGCTTLTGVWTPALYSLYADGSYGTAFNDITSGNTDMTGSNGGDYPATSGYNAATGIGSPIAGGLSCPEITSAAEGYSGEDVTISGLGLEHATISFGGTAAQVLSATATQATVVVPSGSGTVTVNATSVLGSGTQTSSFTFTSPPPPTPAPAPAPAPAPTPTPASHGYWLVGSDGGIFTFGSAQFFGSTGSLKLQRPVAGITPTANDAGYWLVASDGGIFSFGNAQFYGSIPGLGLAPSGSSSPKRLNAPIVGMVPTTDGGGYFMVASDGGVFTFGDAKFEGSCPGIGGCSGGAVAVMPDASGNGYWLVTATGHVYTFGDAAYYGAPGPQSVPVTSAVRTTNGGGYWILLANGIVYGYGDAANLGGPLGSVSGSDPATTIFTTSDGGGYWVSSANGSVFTYGDAPYEGGESGVQLNGSIIAATGW